MKIILDAMGGDFAPDIVVEGAALVRKEMNHELILVGDEEKIKLSAEKCSEVDDFNFEMRK